MDGESMSAKEFYRMLDDFYGPYPSPKMRRTPQVGRGGLATRRRSQARKATRSTAELRRRLDAKASRAGRDVEDLRRDQKLREAEIEVEADRQRGAAAAAIAGRMHAARQSSGLVFGQR